MRKFTMEQALDAIELEQMVVDYFQTLDLEGGGAGLHFFTEDVVVDIGAIKYTGHEGMKKFYAGVAERVKATGEARTGRHGYTNFKVVFPEKNRATVTVLNVTWSGAGTPPLMNASVPSIVTEVRWEARKEADGQWKWFGYYGKPLFVGNDPFLQKSVVGK
jgi:hypothetical protein